MRKEHANLIYYLYFESRPHTSIEARNKVRDLARKLEKYNTIDSNTHMKTDTTYEDNVMNTSNEHPQRKGSKIRDLKILLGNIHNNETSKINDTSVLKKNPREMYLKKIRVKYIKPFQN